MKTPSLLSGYVLSEPGEMDYHKTCDKIGFLCNTIITSNNSTKIFEDLGNSCHPKTIINQKYFNENYHPAYDVNTGECLGYHSLPPSVECQPSANQPNIQRICNIFFFFFYLGFLSRTFTIHGTAGEGGGYLFNSSLPLPPLHRHSDISRAITAESSPLRIADSRTRTGNLWFPSASR